MRSVSDVMYILHRRRRWGQKDIADLYDCDISTVCRHIQQSAANRGEVITGMLMLRPDGSTGVLMGAELFRELYLERGIGINGIADALLCSYGTARNRLLRYNVPLRSAGNPTINNPDKYDNR
jgi:hypothetical protein